MTSFRKLLSVVVGFLILTPGLMVRGQENPQPAHYPEWAKNAVIYEVNVRQHTAEGTFKALEKDLPRLKELGVDILWLMPIYPIGEKNRKGKLGSYYSVRDYKGINPDFGGEKDFASFMKSAHKKGFKVILDWVANHSAWDNPWMTQHPDWYKKDSTGKFLSPYDWTDGVSLNYAIPAMRKAMIDAMAYWIDKFDVDGFRCDVAGMVPVDFWEQSQLELEKRKPVFMLAEDEEHAALYKNDFDMNYSWKLFHLMSVVAKGEVTADSILKLERRIDSVNPTSSIKMIFLTNHDENSWNGTVKELFGNGSKAFALLTYTLPGMPLLYSGQEAGLNKRLRFFEKDTIDWSNKDLFPFYQSLNNFRHKNEAIWSPPYGGSLTAIANSQPLKVISFMREKGNNKVMVIANLSSVPLKVAFNSLKTMLKFKDIFSGEVIEIKPGVPLVLQGWQYRLGTINE